ncbi:MAG: hypothetical protein ACJ77A_09360 [Actinomycetota bacterium]
MIDAAVERLIAAYHEAGLPPIRRAVGLEAILSEVRDVISPLRMPEELERFWRLVDPASITVAPFPGPTTPEFALNEWKSHRDESPGMTPRLLFPVCYESHGFLFVELEDGEGSGGACIEWAYGGSPFSIRFPRLSAYVDLLATMIERGEFARRGQDTNSWIEFDPEHKWEQAQSVRLADSQPLSGFGDIREIDEDVRRWPEHWLLSNGLTAEARVLRGADTTVAELLLVARSGREATGTIRGTVITLAGSGAGWRVAVDDATGVLDVWCPSAVCTYMPSVRRQFEFDVVVHSGPPQAPDLGPERRAVQEHALAHDLEAAQAAAAGLYDRAFATPMAAEASAIRPLD